MKYPKMILFDYGNTLLYEPDFDTLRGQKALLPYIKSNPHSRTPEEIVAFSDRLFAEMRKARAIGFEIHERQFQQLLYEYLKLEFTIPFTEVERIFWENTSPGKVMPGADKMLDFINRKRIRSGVISNISFSGQALAQRINRLLPHNQFEFVITSSEYGVCKPNRLLFELALQKSGLAVCDVWFCGDSLEADVTGAAQLGIFPVWYEDSTVENPWRKKSDMTVPAGEILHIENWNCLLRVLTRLESENADRHLETAGQ